MARPCILGLMAALVAAGPAWPAVRDHSVADAESVAKRLALTQLAFDGPTHLPKGMAPAESGCVLGERVTIGGTIADVERQGGGWSAGVIARGGHCKGLTDLSTGFTALFGDGKPPAACEHGSRFWASGTASSGFQPEFYLKVDEIRCE